MIENPEKLRIEYSVRPRVATPIGWDRVGYSYGSLGISLTNENATGDRLLSIVKWMQLKFDYVVIDLSDTLTRWNMLNDDGTLAPDAREQARNAGDIWLAKNQAIFDVTQGPNGEQKSPPILIRWDDWLDHPEFSHYCHAFSELYEAGGKFKANVEKDVRHFLQRAENRGQVVDDKLRRGSLKYIIEELAVHTLLAQKIPENLVQVYPGSDLNASDIIRRGEVPEAPFGLQRVPFVSLRVGETQRLIPELSKPVNQQSVISPSSGT